MTKVTSVLAGISYFHALPPEELRRVAAQAVVRSAGRGERVFEEGAPAEGLFIVMDGRVRLIRVSRGGREQVLHTEGPGATLGEVPLLDGGGYVATAVATQPSRLVYLPRAAVLDACRRHPEVALGIIRVLARRVRSFAGLVEQLSLKDLTARTAGLLLAESAGRATFELSTTRDELAARLGTVRELVSRSLSRLRKEGVIRLAGRRVTIVDAERLAELAEG
jgi:CRP/FNR family transcriptional regulator, dissimilatory nitrate respiration regulator